MAEDHVEATFILAERVFSVASGRLSRAKTQMPPLPEEKEELEEGKEEEERSMLVGTEGEGEVEVIQVLGGGDGGGGGGGRVCFGNAKL